VVRVVRLRVVRVVRLRVVRVVRLRVVRVVRLRGEPERRVEFGLIAMGGTGR
jgi:hypothetical protein